MRPTTFYSKTLKLLPVITWKADHVPTEPVALDMWLRKDLDIFQLLIRREAEGAQRLNLEPLKIGKAYYFEAPDSNR